MEGIEGNDVNASEAKGKGTKGRKRAAAKPPEITKRSLNLRVDTDTYERLAVHALRRDCTISELVMEFARTHLREFSIHRNATKADKAGE